MDYGLASEDGYDWLVEIGWVRGEGVFGLELDWLAGNIMFQEVGLVRLG